MEERLSELLKQHSIHLPATLQQRVLSYISLLPSEQTWSQVGDYFASNPSIEEVTDCFECDLSFGTAGLRAQMGIGNARMNVLTVGKAATGLASFLPPHSRLLLGYDHRHNSRAFADISVRVFRGAGHVVDLLPGPVPTPMVAAGMRAFGARYQLGIMITASHNPRLDNGYKVYNEHGAQILDGTASAMAAAIGQVKRIPVTDHDDDGQESFAGDEELLQAILAWYEEQLLKWLNRFPARSCPARIVYTPMHGVGGKFVQRLVQRFFGQELIPVPEQFTPDPDFPTVTYPNPEEGRSALDLAFRTAEAHSASLVFANDPDADRFIVAERNAGSWRIFNGNEIAALLAHFITKHLPKGEEDRQYALLSSCVSSRFLQRLCASRTNFRHESTATGFKNLGNRARELQIDGFKTLLAYEEAIGFAVGSWSLDKDGISALLTMMACIGAELGDASSTLTLSDYLHSIYTAYSAFPVQDNGYLLVPKNPIAIIQRMISDRIPSLARDYPGVRVREATIKSTELELPDGGWLMIRASGTEPKVKYYSEVILSQSDAEREASFRALVQSLIKYLLQ